MPAEKIVKRSGVLIDFVRFRISVDRLQRYSLDATTQINAFGFSELSSYNVLGRLLVPGPCQFESFSHHKQSSVLENPTLIFLETESGLFGENVAE